MALSILDGTQTATTLSTILSSGQHITAHTVVSLGSQAISDITSAVSSGISVSVSSALPSGTNRIGVVTIGAGTVTIGAGTAQIGSVTASISGTVPVSGTFFQATQPVSLATLPSLVAGTAQIGSVTASISGTIPVSISSVTIGNSITISSLPSLVAGTAQIGSVTVGNSITIGSIVTHGVTIANTSVTVNGTFYQATQPVSLATLPSLVASTAQIGSVTASISGTIPVSISSVTIGNSLTIGSIVTHGVTIANTSVTVNGTFYQATQPISISSVTIGNFPATQPVSLATLPALVAGTAQIGSVTASISNFPASTVVSAYGLGTDGTWRGLEMQAGSNRLRVDAINSQGGSSFPISGTVTVGTLPSLASNTDFVIVGEYLAEGMNNYGVIGVQVSNSSLTIGNSVTIGSLPALVAGTAQIGSVTASLSNYNVFSSDEGGGQPDLGIQLGFSTQTAAGEDYVRVAPSNPLPVTASGTVTANTFAVQGTAVTTSNFTSITPSTVLASFNATREVLTIFNEGAGNLHICGGATCTTIAYQVRLSAGDYYEVPNHQTTITHSAVFATAGTARVTQVS